ncbi:MAG: acyl-CoA/acyl-ACP dehydrogenase [Actinomycetota bacterium]|nr:acyl-CoA/acyl-ACP dehydrogenase [Actinomycetota bacterium]
MNFAFTEEQEFLRQTARRFLEDKSLSPTVRQLMETEAGFDRSTWSEIARMGWQGMHIPEAYGGAGFSYLELIVLMEEMGRALLPAPFLSSVCLAANALLVAGSEEQKQRYLPEIASGERTAALAFTEPNGRWDAAGVQLPAKRDGDHYLLSGTKLFVVDGHTADTLLVAARTADTSDPEEGVSLFLVDSGAPGVERRALGTMDMTRKQAEVTLDNVSVPAESLLVEEGRAWPAISRVLDLAVVALAAEQVGGAQRCLEMSVDYAKARVQFGRPIGSFQAIKHKCADMLVQVESARSAAYYAAWAAAEDNQELPLVAPLAKSYCSEAYFFVAAENIQVHGGIGFTWEHDAHLYFKRAKSSELLFGDPAYHRELLAQRIGL